LVALVVVAVLALVGMAVDVAMTVAAAAAAIPSFARCVDSSPAT